MSVMGSIRAGWWCTVARAAIAWALLPCSVLKAEEPVTVEAVGCPDAAELVKALLPLLPGTKVTAGPATGPPSVLVVDLGPRYRVSVAGAERDFEDPARRCDERARSAAVYAALRLRPPTVDLPAPPKEPTQERHRRWRVDLEAAGRFDLGFASTDTLYLGGGELRLAVGYEWIAIALGAGALAPTTVALSIGRARYFRAPLHLDLRATLRRGRFEGDVEAGLSVAVLAVAGEALPSTSESVRAELGVRAALRARMRVSRRVALFLGIFGVVVPRPHELTIDPIGVAGTLPTLWLGMEGGVSVRID